VLGFFGGITWSLLVARVCQLYPYYAPSQLVNRFFRVYDQWNWSKPVMLCEIVEPQSNAGMASLKVWNPKTNPADRQHVMPVITPAFPAMNSTHNVTETTKRILLDEFRRGYEVVKNVEAQKAEWSEVHAALPYFNVFPNFLWIEILAKSDEVYQKFGGWVESKLRILSKQLEAITGMIIHPNPEQYSLRGSDPEWPSGCGMFIGMAFYKDQGAFLGQTIDLRPCLSQFVDVINQWTEKDQYVDQYLLRLKRIKASQLPPYALDAEAEKGNPVLSRTASTSSLQNQK
jgi:poly(A) polymerase